MGGTANQRCMQAAAGTLESYDLLREVPAKQADVDHLWYRVGVHRTSISFTSRIKKGEMQRWCRLFQHPV